MPTNLMTELFTKASALPDDQQDRIAARVLAEIDDDLRWDRAFAKSLPALERLADRVLADHQAGETEQLDPDSL